MIRQTSLAIIAAAWPLLAGQVSKDLQGLPPSATTEVLVQFKATPNDAALDKVKLKGGALKRAFASLGMAHYALTTAAIEEIASNPDVSYVSKNRELSGMLDYANPAVNAPMAFQSGWTGAASASR